MGSYNQICRIAQTPSCDKDETAFDFTDSKVTDVEPQIFSIGSSSMRFTAEYTISLEECCGKCDAGDFFPGPPADNRDYTAECTITRSINDAFSNPLGHFGLFEFELPGGTPYRINSCYRETLTFSGNTCRCGQ